jgi:hypothetical protein
MDERWLGKFVHCEPCSANPKVGTHAKNLWLGSTAAIAARRVGGAATNFWIRRQFEA